MAFRILLALGLSLTAGSLLLAQAELRLEDYAKERVYRLQPQGDAEAKARFLADYKASAWAFAPDWQRAGHPLPLQIRRRRGWQLYDAERQAFSEEHFDSIFFPHPLEAYAGFCQVQYRGQRYLYLLGSGLFKDLPLQATHWRDSAKLAQYVRDRDSAYRIDAETGFYFVRRHGPQYVSLAFRQKEGWGRLQLFPFEDLEPVLLEEAQAASPEALSDFGLLPEVAPYLARLRRKHNIGRIAPVAEEPFALYVQHRKSGGWGLAMGEGEMDIVIPLRYDSLALGPYQQAYIVHRKGLSGVYNLNFEPVLAPRYQAIEVLHLDYTFGLAAKEKDRWRLYALDDGKLLLPESATGAQELLEKWLKR